MARYMDEMKPIAGYKCILPILMIVICIAACKHTAVPVMMFEELVTTDSLGNIVKEKMPSMKETIKGAKEEGILMLRSKPQASMPYILNAEKMNEMLHTDAGEGEMAILNLVQIAKLGYFSREVLGTYAYVAHLGVRHGHELMIYRSYSDVSETSYPVRYYIASFTSDGKMISGKMIASLESPLHITTATIYPDGHIVSQKVNQIWEKSPEEAGYENNKVIKSEVTATENFVFR